MKISFCIITLNEEANLPRCLRSIRELADEIVVVDSGSSDATQEIANEAGARFVSQSWLGYVGQKNRAMELASHEWIFSIDADEELSPELQSGIAALKKTEPRASGFRMPRCVLYEDKWIRHGDWYPDRLVRLFRKDRAKFAGGKVHERLEVRGDIGELSGEIYHHSFKNAADHWARCQKYARLWAESQAEVGRTASVLAPIAHGAFRFLRAYVLRRGFLDGAQGYRIARYAACEVALKYRLLRQLRR